MLRKKVRGPVSVQKRGPGRGWRAHRPRNRLGSTGGSGARSVLAALGAPFHAKPRWWRSLACRRRNARQERCSGSPTSICA